MKGGKRKGAGRKPNPYKTKTIAFRVRVEWEQVIKELVAQKIQELKQLADTTQIRGFFYYRKKYLNLF